MTMPVDTSGNVVRYTSGDNFSRYQCVGYAASGSWESSPTNGEVSPVPLVAVPSPQADYVYVPVSTRARVAIYGPLTSLCDQNDVGGAHAPGEPLDSIMHCANPTTLSDSAERAYVYRINVATREWSLVKLDASGATARLGREINSLSVSEDGKEMMLSLTRRVSEGAFSFQSQFCHDETLEWISLDTASTAQYREGTPIKVVSLPQGASCGGWVEGGATVSPNRSGFFPTLTLHSRSRLPKRIQGGPKQQGRTDSRAFTWSKAVRPVDRARMSIGRAATPTGKP